MASLLERKLIVVTGKGGAGKSTIAGALGLVGARRGRRTLVVEVGERDHLAALYGVAVQPGEEVELEPGLWTLSLDPDRALIEWVRDLGGRLSARVLASSSSFQYFAAAAPGAKELVGLVKLHDLCAAGHGDRYDLIVLDAPATGHALAMLAAPDTFTAIVPGGPLARRADQVREMLADPRISGYVAVAPATELAVSETVELERGLRERRGRDLDAVVVNGTIARRFTAAELARLDALANDVAASGESDRRAGSVAVAAARTARAAGERARAQRRQIARLRRLRLHDAPAPSIVSVPFAFVPRIDHDALEGIARRLDRGLLASD
jgi:anion-transporting  ArsA/GET3 family ATPase